MGLKAIFAVFFLLTTGLSKAQKMAVNYGLAEEQNIPSIAADMLQGKYDYAIAYTTEGYWESNQVHYLVLAMKDGIYYEGTIGTKRTKDGKWPAARMKMNRANLTRSKRIISYLDTSGLWQLNQDSLNNQYIKMPDGKTEWMTIHDATNYRFERINPSGVLLVYAYAHDEFFANKPKNNDRRKFISIRDRFLNFYKAL